MATDGSVSAARNRGRLDISYHAGASRGRPEAGTYVCCWCGVVRDVEGAGGGLPVRRHSYRGNRVELWRIASYKRQKTVRKVKQSRQSRVFPWALAGKNRHTAIKTNGRARGVRFYLILVLSVFGRCPNIIPVRNLMSISYGEYMFGQSGRLYSDSTRVPLNRV